MTIHEYLLRSTTEQVFENQVDIETTEPDTHDPISHATTGDGVAETALRLARSGVPIFPCRSVDEGAGRKAKSPLVKGGFKSATCNDGVVQGWWETHPDAAIGVPTGGVTGLLVIDLDVRGDVNGSDAFAILEAKHGALPATSRVKTAGGGLHVYFKMPVGLDLRCSAGKIAEGVDVRANGGYVVVPPSRLFEGDQEVGPYQYVGDGAAPEGLKERIARAAEPPGWLIDLILKSSGSRRSAGPAPGAGKHPKKGVPAWAVMKLEQLCAEVAGAKESTRNDSLNKAAFAVGQMLAMGVLDRAAAEETLLVAARASGLDEPEARCTMASGVEAGLTKPAERPFFAHVKERNVPDRGSSHNVMALLAWLRTDLRRNAFAGRCEINGAEGYRQLNDQAVADLWGRAHDLGFRVDKSFFRDCLDVAALKNEVHPPRDYFYRLKWDSKPRLDGWLSTYLGAVDDEYTREVGPKVCIAAVRRIMKPGTKFDQLLILEGAQGTGKSSALSIMAVQTEWFTDAVDLTDDCKRMIEQTEGKLIVEVPELKGMRKADAEHVKSMLSRTRDRARKAYGHYADDVARQFILVATANPEKGGVCWYLRDPTGNRRFWPVRTGNIDLEALREDRDQLWAEAVVREAEGEAIELPAALWRAAEHEQQARMEVDPWVEELANVLGDLEGKLLTTDARKIITRYLGSWDAYGSDKLGRAMRTLGWEKRELRTQTGRGRAYYYTKGEFPWRDLAVTVEADSAVSVRMVGA